MSSEKLKGYRGKLFKLLSSLGAEVGRELEVETKDRIVRGLLMPRHELADEEHIVIKLPSGYNIGIRYKSNMKIKPVTSQPFTKPHHMQAGFRHRGLARVSILGTGGTIASRVDYRTGGVRPAISAEELVEIMPELGEVADLEPEVIMSKYSENLTTVDWARIAREVADRIKRGVDGVVVLHGTDTMGYTAAALSFALRNPPVPVILTGSQRSSDRPSSDAALNLISSVLAAAKAPFAEVAVAMYENLSDNVVALYRGTRVRKNHTSRRDAFQTIDFLPYGKVVGGRIEMFGKEHRQRGENEKFRVEADFEARVALLKSYPGFDASSIDLLVENGYRGIVFEGTGLGHLPNNSFPSIKKAIESGVLVCVTSQCIWGRTNLMVYDNGRDLLRLGVLSLENMLSETAYVKLCWVLAQTRDLEEASRIMLINIAGEITKLSPAF